MPADTSSNPFPGLRPFRPDEDYLFFGREGQSEEILRRLRVNRFLAVIGISGSGKSSLIRAGLLPHVYGGFMAGASSHWRVALFRPGNDPLGNLAHALSDCAVLGDAGSGETDAAKNEILIEVTLRRSGLGLLEAVRLARLPENENLLIVVDQFEELFRYGHADSAVHQQDDAAAFVKLLCEATQQSALPIYIVITMRSDFIGDCARFRDLPEAVTGGLYLIPRMSREQRRQAIEGPVQVGHGAISRRLINRLLNDGGDDPDQLPSLQHALMRTWIYWKEHSREAEPIDLPDYLAVGGMPDALSRHAEEAFDDLPNERARAIAKRLFQSLTEKGSDNREVRRPTKLRDVAAMADTSTAEVVSVIDAFRCEGRSFLTPPPEVALGDDSVIDISHESLIRGWSRLKTWVEEEYESAKIYRRLAETAALYGQGDAGLWNDPDLANALRWKENEKPTAAWAKCYHRGFEPAMAFLEKSQHARDEAAAERERNRRRKLRNTRLFAATVMVLLFLAVGMAIDARQKTKEANENARKAEIERDNATRAKKTAVLKQQEADAATTKAVQATAQALTNRDMALGFASSTVQGFSELNDFTLSLNEVHDNFESLLNEAAKVHQGVLSHDPTNFAASVMRVNALSAQVRLHRVTGRSSAAQAECGTEEAEAGKLVQAGNSDSQRILGAYMLAKLAATRMDLGDRDRAVADAARAISVSDGIDPDRNGRSDGTDQQALRCLSIAYTASAGVEAQYGDQKAALKHRNRAIEVLTGPADQSAMTYTRSLDDHSRVILLLDLKNLAVLQNKANLTNAALGTYSKAVQLAHTWGHSVSDNHGILDSLVWLYISRGDLETTLKDYRKAQEDFVTAENIGAKKLDASSNDGQYDVAAAEERLGSLKHYQADAEQDKEAKHRDLLLAREWHDKALTRFRKMEDKKGKSPYVEYSIGNEESNLAWDSNALNENDSAKQHYEASRVSYELSAEVDQTDEHFSSAARANRALAELFEKTTDWKAAISCYEKAIGFDRKMKQTAEFSDTDEVLLEDLLWLGNAQSQDKQGELAQKTLNEGIALAERWSTKGPAPAQLTKDLIRFYIFRGDVLRDKKAFSEAEADYRAADRILPQFDSSKLDGKSEEIRIREHVGELWSVEADQEANAAKKREAFTRSKESRERALKLRREVEAAGKTASTEEDIAGLEKLLGSVCYNLQQWDEAQTHFVASAEAYKQAAQLVPSKEASENLHKAYLLIAYIYVLRADDDLAHGRYEAAEEAFASSRTAAHRPDVTMSDLSLQAEVEEYIGESLRKYSDSEKSAPRREDMLRQALQADENSLKLRGELAAASKTAEAERAVGIAEKNIGQDFMKSKDQENAKKYFALTLKTFKESKLTNETARSAAGLYRGLAELELEVNDRSAAREALASQIEALRPLMEDAKTTPDDRANLANALGVRSWENSLLGDPWAALSDADQALFIDDKLNFVRINKADAYLLLGQTERARELYDSVADKVCGSQPCRDAILGDLSEIKSHPELRPDSTALASIEEAMKKRPAVEGAPRP